MIHEKVPSVGQQLLDKWSKIEKNLFFEKAFRGQRFGDYRINLVKILQATIGAMCASS